ncbi:MAG: efflux RND transporter periplasmic adaptor subunit [Planctomycetaceae bacterium]
MLVIITLAGIGAYGHFNHWKLPSYTELTGSVATLAQDWCEEHGVPESRCINCNSELMPPGPDYGWCTEHGVHNCVLHHPDVAQLKEPPESTGDDMKRATVAISIRERPHNNAACQAYQQRIQFASVDAVQQAGVDVELVDRHEIRESVTGNGEIRYDATRFAKLSSRVEGSVWKVFKNIGDPVEEEEIITVIDALEVGRFKGELIKAIVNRKLAKKNTDRLSNIGAGVVAGKEVLNAQATLEKTEAEVLSAEQALANLGLEIDATAALRNEQ